MDVVFLRLLLALMTGAFGDDVPAGIHMIGKDSLLVPSAPRRILNIALASFHCREFFNITSDERLKRDVRGKQELNNAEAARAIQRGGAWTSRTIFMQIESGRGVRTGLRRIAWSHWPLSIVADSLTLRATSD
jgi:hypothetical protein